MAAQWLAQLHTTSQWPMLVPVSLGRLAMVGYLEKAPR